MRLLDRLRQAAALALARYGPKAQDWPIPGAWPAQYYDLAPVAVVDLCGGVRGVSKWENVSEPCATWTVSMLKCQQACHQTHWSGGFGGCMARCSGQPREVWCEQPASASWEVRRYCRTFVARWRDCMVNMTDRFENSSEWAGAVDGCVFDCGAALRIQHELQYELGPGANSTSNATAAANAEPPRPLGWHASKCAPKLFGCGGRGWCEEVVNQTECKPPLGTGETACSVNDLHCDAKCPPPWLFNASNSSNASDAGQEDSGSWGDMFR